MGRMHSIALVAAVAILSSLVASCGSSEVVRGPSSHRSTRTSLPPVRVSTPRYGSTAVVQRGDTIYHIATVNGLTALDLALWNGIPPPYTIYPGQRLRLYPGAAPVARSTTPARTVPSTPSVPTPPPVVSTPTNAPFAWRWPTEGSLVESYAAGDPTRQGIDIAGSAGQPVRAAADGVVVYSGSGLVGYGELIIVKHNDQWLSAYGHNRARLVNEGQLVKAGQQIAEMGRSGAARDMLHFEIRYNGKPVDPQQYLPKK
ncbi:MAG: peptidoglycan DD-metalloendopeptidase family protein [Thermomonas sp.]